MAPTSRLNSLSPCSIAAVVAGASALTLPNATPSFPGMPLANSNAKLTINNVGAPVLSIGTLPNGQQQLSFQVPCEVLPGSSVPATLNLGGGTTNVNLQIQAASPGVYQQIMSDDVARAVVVRPDGTFASLQNPARRGETVVALSPVSDRPFPASEPIRSPYRARLPMCKARWWSVWRVKACR